MKIKNRIPIRILTALVAVLLSLLCFAPTILAAESASISLNAWDRSEALNFSFQNIVPGDSEMKEYAIKIMDKKAVHIQFSVICESDNKLADGLYIKVATNGEASYDGPLSKIGILTYTLPTKGQQTVIYNITIYMPTTATSEYAGLSLNTNLKWTITREDAPPKPPVETTTAATTTPAETTTGTTSTEITTPIVTTPTETTTPIATTPAETTTVMTTAETTAETTMVIIPIETTTAETTTLPLEPPTSEHRCKCCIGYYFPFSCNFRFNGGDHCDLFWCCNRDLGIGCWCPWCWIIPLIIIIIIILIIILLLCRKRFGDYCDDWIEKIEEDKENPIDPITLEKHKNAVDNHIKPQFGKVFPKKLTPEMMQEFTEYLQTASFMDITMIDTLVTLGKVLDYCHEKIGKKFPDVSPVLPMPKSPTQNQAAEQPNNEGGDDLGNE